MTTLSEATLSGFRRVVVRALGLSLDDANVAMVEEIIRRRADADGETPAAYVERLERCGVDKAEVRALASELTVGETYFFRHAEQFRALEEVGFPDRIAANRSTRRLTALSAGCASGEEAYSLAILARERAMEITIRAIDVNTAALARAARAVYSPWSFRETPMELRRRWFRAEGRDFKLDHEIVAAVQFDERNLTTGDADLWAPATYDVIFCRNVLMYFNPEHARRVVSRFARALVPGGYLFLGHAETLRGLSQDFHLRHTHGTFYYQRRQELSREQTADPPLDAPRAITDAPVADIDWAATWVDTVQRATERIQALSEHRLDGPKSAPTPKTRQNGDLGNAFALLREERFTEALGSLGALPPEAARDPDVLLLRAVLLTHGGQVDAAASTCGELLARDELNAGAHYVLALCREVAGDERGAADHDQVATYLDPTFAMPRLHLGLMARRVADLEGAKRELSRAIVLLQREDASRLLLFGGGFGREGLVALCRAELDRLGDAP